MAQLDSGVRSRHRRDRSRACAQQNARPSSATASRVYDEYLRANRVADGTASYGRALTLILGRRHFRTRWRAIGDYGKHER